MDWASNGHWMGRDGDNAIALVHARLAEGIQETWFEDPDGRRVSIVTNGERAMLLLLEHPTDDGMHLIDTTAGSQISDGFVHANGQHDVHTDAHTVPLGRALTVLSRIIEGRDTSHFNWQEDR